MVGALLAVGADLETRSDNGETPLHFAARYNEDPAVVEALLAAGADPLSEDSDDSTALHLAARYNENPSVLEALLAAGFEREAHDDEERTPLHLAARYNENSAVVEALLAAGANIEAVDEDGRTPLYRATDENDNPAVREVLLRAGAGRTERARASEQGDGVGRGIAALIGGAAIAAAGVGSGANPETVADAVGQFAEGVLTGQPAGGASGIAACRAGPNKLRRRVHQRAGMPDPRLSDSRQRAEPGIELVRVERRFPKACLRPAGSGRMVCDRRRHVVNSRADPRPPPGDQRGVRHARCATGSVGRAAVPLSGGLPAGRRRPITAPCVNLALRNARHTHDTHAANMLLRTWPPGVALNETRTLYRQQGQRKCNVISPLLRVLHRCFFRCLMLSALGVVTAGVLNGHAHLRAESGMQADHRVTQRQLVGSWLHAHEEDPQDGSGLQVYRPSSWPLGPSRGRRGFELRADSHALLLGIAAADGIEERRGRWSIQSGNVLLIETHREVWRMRIATIAPDRLVVRELPCNR